MIHFCLAGKQLERIAEGFVTESARFRIKGVLGARAIVSEKQVLRCAQDDREE
jgi:hypothetical protein